MVRPLNKQQNNICNKTIDRIKQTQIILWQILQTDKIDRHRKEAKSIEALEEILGSLRITEEYTSDRNRTIEISI